MGYVSQTQMTIADDLAIHNRVLRITTRGKWIEFEIIEE